MTTSYYCVVKDCKNGSRTLLNWKTETCSLHNIKYEDCVCRPPFKLFSFPTIKKDQKNRNKWIVLVNRVVENKKQWNPTAHSRICSKHFVGGEPSITNSIPTLFLGYDASSRIKNISEPCYDRHRYHSKNMTNVLHLLLTKLMFLAKHFLFNINKIKP